MSATIITYNLDNLELNKLKALLWETMKSKWKQNFYQNNTFRASYNDICMSVAKLAVQKKIIANPTYGHYHYTSKVSNESCQKIGSILWSLVAQEILYVDMSNPGNFVFDITEYGRQVLTADYPIPNDPDGYLSYLKNIIPDIDETIYSYISESIEAYNHRLYLSATTAIGCASEKAFLLLLEAYVKFLPSKKERDKFEKQKNKQIKKQFEEFQKSFSGQKSLIDKELTDGIDIVFNGIFEFLRQNRNSTGHPTGKPMSKELVFASLQLFITYCKRIYGLISFFNKNGNSN